MFSLSKIFDFNLSCQCSRCGKWFGVLPSEGIPSYAPVTRLRLKHHKRLNKCEERKFDEFDE